MDIKGYITPLVRWWWLLVVAILISSVSSYYVVRKQPNIYSSHSTLMIGNIVQDPNPNSSQFYLAQQLASTYADLANRELIQKVTMKALGLPFLPTNLARAIPNTSLIEIDVTDTNPSRACAVANELANELINKSPSGLISQTNSRQVFIDDQLNKLQDQIQ